MPNHDRSSVTVVGAGKSFEACTLSGSGRRLPFPTMFPRYVVSKKPNVHLLKLQYKSCCSNRRNTRVRCSMCDSQVSLKIKRSSRRFATKVLKGAPLSVLLVVSSPPCCLRSSCASSMALSGLAKSPNRECMIAWKCPGTPLNPNGHTVNWNCPKGVVMAVSC